MAAGERRQGLVPRRPPQERYEGQYTRAFGSMYWISFDIV
jgi:hypothetical protein